MRTFLTILAFLAVLGLSRWLSGGGAGEPGDRAPDPRPRGMSGLQTGPADAPDGAVPLADESGASRGQAPRAVPPVNRPRLGDPLAVLEAGPVLTYSVEHRMDSPFYRGSGPLVFKATTRPTGHSSAPGIFPSTLTISHQFEGWETVFFRNDRRPRGDLDELGWMKLRGMPTGACALDARGQRLAEAVVVELVDTQLHVDEFHLDHGGRVRFFSRSRFSPLTGDKQAELETSGSKKREYFLIWPVREH